MLNVEVGGTIYYSMSWAEVEEYASDLAEKIYRVYQLDTLLAVMKGGAIVGVLMADRLGVGRIYTVNVRSYERVGLRGKVEMYQKPPRGCIEGKQILAVDDIADSGQSLSIVTQLIRRYGARDMRTATLLVKEGSRYIPDFYMQKVKGWVFYPWEVREACEEIYAKAGNIEKAQKILTADLGFQRKQIKRTLAKVRKLVK